jgi:hypothetical protein
MAEQANGDRLFSKITDTPISAAARYLISPPKENPMRTLDKVRQSIDIIFLYGLTAGLIIAITAIILAKLPE